jgi:SH3 domain protein
MIIRFIMPMFLWFICLILFLPMLAQAETRYVTDTFEITLRSGPSGSHTIQRMIKSGTTLEVLERDPDNGYSKVRTTGGTEGWVLSRYLMGEPAARVQLESLSSKLANTTTKGNNIRSQVDTIKHQLDSAAERVAILENENKKLGNELTEIKQVAANTLAIDSQNKELRQRVTNAESQKNTLLQENYALSTRKERDWFIAGALVLFGGMIVGIILTRIQWRKRSRYDGF